MVQTRSQKQAEKDGADQNPADEKLLQDIAANVALVLRSQASLEPRFASRAIRNASQLRQILNIVNLEAAVKLLDKSTFLLQKTQT
jgi:hypothetical protein